MGGVEASGKTVEEAIERALDELDATRDEVAFEVLAEPKGGILGVGAADARVRVWRTGEGAAAGEEGGTDGEGELIEDDAEMAAQMLDHLLELMGITADVSIRDAETPGDGLGMAKAVLDIEGDDLGLLIGRRGETLASLQYLLNLMVGRKLTEHATFTVDVEGYRRRREKQLNQLARRMADQVRRTRRPVTLEPMPPNERRIVHLTLAEDREVETSSIGEGENRKVSISLKR
ncbi:MAG: RNA-binding cell elongation regulator Jag/EloR [Chloroflexota bacterium]